jgi:hypothetical protein
MSDRLPILIESQIVVDVEAAIVTASFLFDDGARFPVHIGWETLRSWAVTSHAYEIKATILEHCSMLAPLALKARAAGESFLALL